MNKTSSMRSLLAKAMRIVLVFALVFGTTLHLEYSIAYGYGTVNIDDGSTHSEEKLTDLVIYEWSGDRNAWLPVVRASHDGTNPITVPMAQEAGSKQFAAMPIWDGAYPEGDSLTIVTSATFANWEVVNDTAGCLSTAVGDDNVITLTVNAAGSAQLQCKARDLKPASFAIAATAPEPDPGTDPGTDPDNPDPSNPDNPTPSDPEVLAPELAEVSILNDKGQPFSGDPQLTFDKKDIDETYQLQAAVEVNNLNAGKSYSTTSGQSLSEFSAGELNDLTWVTSDEAIVAVDDQGLLTVKGEGRCTISCIATVKSTTQMMQETIAVEVGSQEEKPEEKPDPQGQSHPQNSLQIIANLSTSSGTTDDEGTPGSTDEQLDSQAEDGNSEDGSPDASQGSQDQNINIDKTYSIEELESLSADGTLPLDTRTFLMKNGQGPLTIVGNGFSFMDFVNHAFEEAGADLSKAQINTVDFIDYRGVRTTVDWKFLQAASAQIALKSYVEVDEETDDKDSPSAGDNSSSSGSIDKSDESQDKEGDDEGQEGENPSQPELLDNTRFRVLFNEGAVSIDGDALRYIKTIQLNGNGTNTDELEVGISYVPVPLGVEAEFVASPNHNINGRWDCQWEQSTDGGITWEKINGAISQTLRVLTSAETVGTFYRVTIDNSTSISSGEATDHLTATSEPVEMQIGTGFSVVLSYNPPRAGDMAIFRSSIYDYDGDVTELDYVWEFSEDGGGSWTVIKNANKSTLKIPTEPVSEDGGSGSEGGGETPNLIYIRVRAITPSEEVRVSNAQPLTVHVGDDNTDVGGDDDNGQIGGDTLPKGEDTKKPTPTNPSQSTTRPAPSPKPMMPIDSIVIEGVDQPAEALDPTGSLTPTPQIYVNETVTDQVVEQNQIIQEQKNETTPGARWTALKTLNPTSDDVRRVLEDNPLASYVIPFVLGLIAVGALEKFISYRRQIA